MTNIKEQQKLMKMQQSFNVCRIILKDDFSLEIDAKAVTTLQKSLSEYRELLNT